MLRFIRQNWGQRILVEVMKRIRHLVVNLQAPRVIEDQPKGSQADQEEPPNDTPRSGSPEETTENDELETSSVNGNFGGPNQDANACLCCSG